MLCFCVGSSTSLTRSDRSLRNDLLVAADSVTNAMSTLVRELNSEGSDQDDSDSILRKQLGKIYGCVKITCVTVNDGHLSKRVSTVQKAN